MPGAAADGARVAQHLLAVDALQRLDRRVAHRAHALGAQHLVGQLQVDRDLAVQLPVAHRRVDSVPAAVRPCTLAHVLLAAERRPRLREELFRFRIARGARGKAAERHRERDQRTSTVA